MIDTSNSLKDRDCASLWHPFSPIDNSITSLPIIKALGSTLYGEDGKSYLDAISSWWVTLHGHSQKDIVAAIAKQASILEHVIFAGFTHEPAITLAEKLLAILPSNQKKIFYTDNGSTAVEAALKMAIQFFANQGVKRTGIVALAHSYHGDTLGAMSVSERGVFTLPFHEMLVPVSVIDISLSQDEVTDRFTEIVKSGTIASFIYEPLIQGSSGMRMYSAEVLEALIKIAKSYDVVCIADEVMTGFGRTGSYFASLQLASPPDIVCMAKGLTGGFLPMGAVSATEKIHHQFKSKDFSKVFLHGHSYTGNPLSCAAAIASIDLLTGDECQFSLKRICESQRDFVSSLAHHPKAFSPRCLGTISAVQYGENNSSYTSVHRNRLYAFCLSQGVLLRPLGNVLYSMPPYCCTDKEMTLIHTTIKQALDVT